MQARKLALGLVCAASLFGQRGRFSWQEACFKNPGAPFCQGHEYAVKKKPPSKDGGALGPIVTEGSWDPQRVTPSVIVVGAINWRFADPSADALLAIDLTRIPANSPGRSLITQFAGPGDADVQKLLKSLTGVSRLAVSVKANKPLLMVTGPATESIPGALQSGWKAVTVTGGGLLIGDPESVDQGALRIATASSLSELARVAGQLVNSDFFAVGLPQRLNGAPNAGLKFFAVAASLQDRVVIQSIFEFDPSANAEAIRKWATSQSGATIDGNVVQATANLELDAINADFKQLSASLLGKQLTTLVESARLLPPRDDVVTQHARPVIYGLDNGPREVKQ